MTNNQQPTEPTPDQALETIISAVRLLPLKYDDHVALDRCVNILRKVIDDKKMVPIDIDREALDRLNWLTDNIKDTKAKIVRQED